MKHVKVYDDSQRVHGKVGRPKAVTKEQLLHAIEMYATDSVTILAKKLQVSRKTIYARLEGIPRIKHGKKQEIETLINEEAYLFAMYLRNDRKTWKPRIVDL